MEVSLRLSAMLENSLWRHESLNSCSQCMSVLHIGIQDIRLPPSHTCTNKSTPQRAEVWRGPISKLDGKAAVLGNHKTAEPLRRAHRATTEPPTFPVSGKRDGIDLWPHSSA
jgi:hypothetical protein